MKLINADCIEAMKAMPDNSVDSIVTDPPYELGFMGKSWDASGIAFNVDVWREALRVIKPGGHLIAFGGSRTYHRMAVAIEDAGFEIRDQIMWVYGSGFPKSHNVSKGIDKAAGTLKVIGKGKAGKTALGQSSGYNHTNNPHEFDLTEPNSDAAKQWDGWGTALKPAHEPMVLARKPFIGTVANNVMTHGTGGLNIDGARVGSQGGGNSCAGGDSCKCSDKNEIFGATKHPVKPLGEFGRWPANFIHDGSDEVVALFPDSNGAGGSTPNVKVTGYGDGIGNGTTIYTPNDRKGFDSGSGSAARFFYCAKASKRDRNEGLDGFKGKEIGSKGNGLARKCATCSASVIDGCACPNRTFVNPSRANHHPTVKPTTLMQYLVRLVTPPNGIVLDPFMGSGSTGKACAYEGFDFIGIDQSAEYVAIAQARIDFALADK